MIYNEFIERSEKYDYGIELQNFRNIHFIRKTH